MKKGLTVILILAILALCTGMATAAKPEVGDVVTFGNYEQDNNIVNGAEPIEWQVLEVEKGKALLYSRYALEKIQFNTTSAKQTWSNSTIRGWLNGIFYYEAFNADEQKYVKLTEVDESISQADNDHPPKRIGEDTEDYVFLLSYKELSEYLTTKSSRLCRPTEHAISQGCNQSNDKNIDGKYKSCWYWLRTPAYNNNACVVDWDGSFETCYMNHAYGVARPAIWVDTSYWE
mgnify:CR=1 FL=1